jgi:hypothetical protein
VGKVKVAQKGVRCVRKNGHSSVLACTPAISRAVGRGGGCARLVTGAWVVEEEGVLRGGGLGRYQGKVGKGIPPRAASRKLAIATHWSKPRAKWWVVGVEGGASNCARLLTGTGFAEEQGKVRAGQGVMPEEVQKGTAPKEACKKIGHSSALAGASAYTWMTGPMDLAWD